MLAVSLGSGCFVAFFIFSCESDFDCTASEFCDVDGSCVDVFFLKETDTCLVEHDCDIAVPTDNEEPTEN